MPRAGFAGQTREITREHILLAARERFLNGERIDVLAIAVELGIARATVYRWFGGRNGVEGEMLWRLGAHTVTRAAANARSDGVEGVVDALVETLEQMTSFAPFQLYLASDPRRAMEILTGADSIPAAGLRDAIEQLVLERCPSAVSDQLPSEELAFALLRIYESYCYADIIAGRSMAPGHAAPVFRRLLGGA